MKTKTKHPVTGFTLQILAASLVLLINAMPAIADQDHAENRYIVSPDDNYRGLSYNVWMAEWFRWVYSLPTVHHPLFDTADCSTGQADDVWFIGGSFEGKRAVIRDCTVPHGTALFLSLANASWDNEACDEVNKNVIKKTNFTETELRARAQKDFIRGILDKKSRIIIDGQEVEGMPTNCNSTNPASCESPFRVKTPVFDYTSPALDSLLLGNGDCYIDPNHNGQPYTVTGAVGEGVHIMIKPLPIGKHTIQFGAFDSVTGLPRSRYNITVTEHGHEHERDHEHEHGKKGFD
ncbi:MAG: hypothetical protein NTW85_12035 [Methylococcales bacterium]|nr:hypothetical protein [Methylococcales bacterium]